MVLKYEIILFFQLVIVVSQMTWCRDVHEILKLDSNIQESLIEFERKCFKLSISITNCIKICGMIRIFIINVEEFSF